MLRISLISNELPPYRVPFFSALSRMPDVVLEVLFCTRREPNRRWEIPALDFGHQFLRERIITFNGRYIHNNPGVIPALYRFRPDVIITGGFNPTHLYAYLYATLRGVPHVAMTDGTEHSERGLSRVHRLVRRAVYARSRAFIAASQGGQRLFRSYGIAAADCFRSCLCIDNTQFSPGGQPVDKPYDFLFCGRIEAVKNPLFALEVAAATSTLMGRRTRMLFVGAGEQEAELRAAAQRHASRVDVDFNGFVSHADLPSIYHSARLFLFPSSWDPWGVVANEACAAGLPVLVSPEAGVANELVIDGRNGHVCELDVNLWAKKSAALLGQPELHAQFSLAGLEIVKDYNYASAAAGVVAACRHARLRGKLARTGLAGQES